MKQLQNCKFVQLTPPGVIVDDASYTTAALDTAGFGYCAILVCLGATDIAMAALKLQQSDASGSGFADITGAVGGTDFTLPTSTDDNKIVAFFVDLRGKKRYLDVVATAGNGSAGTYTSIVAILAEGSITPDDITERGLVAQVLV
jgi:hypothetical protein